jgi:hypothetical protein
MSRFAVLKPPATPPAATPTDPTPKPARRIARGKSWSAAISAPRSRAVKVLAAEQGTTVQA